MEADAPIVDGELVLLWHAADDAFLVLARAGPQTVPQHGVVDLTDAFGRSPGTEVNWGGQRFRVVRPTLEDRLDRLRRKPQIVTGKDAPQLLRLAGVGPGSRVVEAGAGSGALTLTLAHAVGPDGHVISYDKRREFLDVARENLWHAGLLDRVELRLRDVGAEGLDCGPVVAALFDLPEPWTVLPALRTVLVPGGAVACYSPTYNQLERTVRALRTEGFVDVVSQELLERRLHVGEGGTRPEFEMLGHTGFLTGARWMGPPW